MTERHVSRRALVKAALALACLEAPRSWADIFTVNGSEDSQQQLFLKLSLWLTQSKAIDSGLSEAYMNELESKSGTRTLYSALADFKPIVHDTFSNNHMLAQFTSNHREVIQSVQVDGLR